MAVAGGRERVSERVHEHLRGAILGGDLRPGEAVPSERTLSYRLGVNRHAVREALKRLEQAGLVQISQGGATRVLDWRDTAGLEVLLDLLAAPPARPPSDLARAVLEMRASIGVDAARRCAARAGEKERAELRALAGRTAEAIGSDLDAVDQGYAALWLAVVSGADNIAYRLALNSLLAALVAFGDLARDLLPDDPERVRALGEAIAAGDEHGAEAAARRLLEPDTRFFG